MRPSSTHLGPVENDWETRVSQFTLTLSRVVVAEKEVILKRFQVNYEQFGDLLLTSSDVRQYQQKTCLHLLHIIWAQPASLSIGTAHIGHLLMFSASAPAIHIATSPAMSTPCLTRAAPFSAHERPGCQAEEQSEQNSLTHVGHVTGTPADLFPVQIWQIVSQPACGHHVRLASRDTSVNKEHDDIIFTRKKLLK